MKFNKYQIEILEKLKQAADFIAKDDDKNFLESIFSNKKFPKNIYIYGEVGRGKSMLMKDFLNRLPQNTKKIYIHFHSFMRAIHEALRDIRNEKKKYKDELIEALKRVIKDNKVICFDEFQVLDIADAMILGRIFSYIFSKKIFVVFTSNSHPKDLYKNGLQREIFLEFIENIFLKNCEVCYLGGEFDYRSAKRENLEKRYFISNAKNREIVAEIIESLSAGKKPKKKKIKVWGREIIIKKTFDKIAVINFDDLFRAQLSASDYQEVCKNFELIFLLKIPQLTSDDANEARRFINFIDEVYENKIPLIIISKVIPEKIYENGIGSDAFKRTISRLKEIRTFPSLHLSNLNKNA